MPRLPLPSLLRLSTLSLSTLAALLVTARCADYETPTAPVTLARGPQWSIAGSIGSAEGHHMAQQRNEQLQVGWFETSGCLTRGANLSVFRTTGTEPIQVSRLDVHFSEFDDCANEMVFAGSGTLPLGTFEIPENLDTVTASAHDSIAVTSGAGTRMLPVVVDVTLGATTPPQISLVFRPHMTCATAVEGLRVPCNRTLHHRGGDVTGTMSLNGVNFATLALNFADAFWMRNICIMPENTPNDPVSGVPCETFERVIF